MSDCVIRDALELADALDDERGGADRFAAARLLREVVQRERERQRQEYQRQQRRRRRLESQSD